MIEDIGDVALIFFTHWGVIISCTVIAFIVSWKIACVQCIGIVTAIVISIPLLKVGSVSADGLLDF